MLVALLRLMARLPLPVLHALGNGIGRLVYAFPGRYRRRLQSNCRQAGYDSPAFFRQAAGQAGAMILETPRVWLYP
ncbi:lysophospholipid acyltransferase family protein, partial [Alcaligenes pakistanensis]